MRVMNFSAGPAALPESALEQARDELLDWAGTGMSVMEQSHRAKAYDALHEETLSLFRELCELPASHDVLLLQGGASQQFAMVPMNFLGKGEKATYVVTGTWGEKAAAEASVVAAARDARVVTHAFGSGNVYTRLPGDDFGVGMTGAKYVHFTSNETIDGVQFSAEALASAFDRFSGTPVVCDVSSDFLSGPFDYAKAHLVYAGAQKNIGPSGLVIVIAHRDWLLEASSRVTEDVPSILRYATHHKARSLANTPPTLSIYFARNVLQWIKREGGPVLMNARNAEKAASIYAAIGRSGGFYLCPVELTARSRMNVVFRLPSEELESRFVAAAEANKMVGLKGHRTVGGIRVSLYNAVEPKWAHALASFMGEFARTNG